MQEKGFIARRKPAAAAAALCLVLLIVAQQVCAAPAASQTQTQPGSPGSPGGGAVLRRKARMTPLWRTMNSKPFGAYCQNNYECSTGICRAGHCSASQRSPSEPVKY